MWRRIRQALYLTLALASIAGGVWGVQRWRSYPKVPDVKTAKLDDALAFIGTEDFNRMFESHRRRYAIAVAERMREKSFGEILTIFIRNDPGREQRWRNLRAIPDHEKINDAYVRLFLDKFFEESPARQQ